MGRRILTHIYDPIFHRLLSVLPGQVLQLAAQLAVRLAKGEVLYLHCWGGHGRTGTVVSIMLHLMYGLGAEESMERCQRVHDVRRIPISVGSPQTEAQREQVCRVVARLIKLRATIARMPVKPLPRVLPVSAKAELTSKAAGTCSSLSTRVSDKTSTSAAKQRPSKLKSVTTKSVTKSEVHASVPAEANSFGNVRCKNGGTGVVEGVDTGAGRQSTAGSVMGRRQWVRGRREAFAPAPNGVGEDVSGWLPNEDASSVTVSTTVSCVGANGSDEAPLAPADASSSGEDDIGAEDKHGEDELSVADNGTGKRSRVRASSWREHEADADLVFAPLFASCQADSGDCDASSSISSSSHGRRKSCMDPPFLEDESDASRTARSNRLRRKSAPGQSPRSAELDLYRATIANDAAKDESDLSPPVSAPVSASASAVPVTPGVTSSSPGSCTGLEQCAPRSRSVSRAAAAAGCSENEGNPR